MIYEMIHEEAGGSAAVAVASNIYPLDVEACYLE